MKKHIEHFFKASGYSLAGLIQTYKTEMAFKQEVLVLVVLAILGVLFFSWTNTVILLAGWCVVMIAELLNSAIESICELVSPEHNELIKHAKDAASASVAVAIGLNVLLWLYVLFS